jgi:hypothetical protein
MPRKKKEPKVLHESEIKDKTPPVGADLPPAPKPDGKDYVPEKAPEGGKVIVDEAKQI